jgi:hypothetical protein
MKSDTTKAAAPKEHFSRSWLPIRPLRLWWALHRPETAMVSKAVPRPSYNPTKKRPAGDRAPIRFQLLEAAFGPSLDLEIIAQGEADEKHEDDRKGILPEHQPVVAFRGNG